jgi:hypothetical protein
MSMPIAHVQSEFVESRISDASHRVGLRGSPAAGRAAFSDGFARTEGGRGGCLCGRKRDDLGGLCRDAEPALNYFAAQNS